MAPGSRIWYETESRECLETVGSEDCQLIGGCAGSDEPLGGDRVGAERESHVAGAMVSRLRSTSPARRVTSTSILPDAVRRQKTTQITSAWLYGFSAVSTCPSASTSTWLRHDM